MVEQFDSEAFGAELTEPLTGNVGYSFSTIDFPGATSTFLNGINNNGQMVGAQRDENGVRHSVLADTDAFNTFDPPGFTNTAFPGISEASGINDTGEIVGDVINNDNAGSQAYITSGNAFSLYSHPDADPSNGTAFIGINNAGVRVGAFNDTGDTPHGIVQVGDATTLLEETVDVPANAGTFIFDINNRGQMVGGYFDPILDIQHGFLTDGNTFTTIDFPGSSTTWLNGINDLGQMVGAYFDDATQAWHGFLTDGKIFRVLDFPTVPSGQHPGTFLAGINNVGRIVGYYGDNLNNLNRPGTHGFIATPVSTDGGLRIAGGRQHFSPPTCIRTWFHQGAVGDEVGDFAELDLSAEFWSGDGCLLTHKHGVNAFLRTLESRRMRRDALRALRGSILRAELYTLDGTTLADRPYAVTEHAYGLRLEAVAVDSERPAVFFPHHVAQRTTQWERGDDPLTQFTFTDTEDYDAFGQLLRSTSVACPRGWKKLADMSAEPYLATRTRTTYAIPTDPDTYLFNRIARTTTFELTNDGQVTVEDLHSLPDDSPSLVIFGQRYSYYDGSPFQGLPFGQVGPFGALVRAESLVLTEGILHDAYKSGNAILDPPEEPPYLARGGTPPWTAEYPEEFRSLVSALAGYTFHPGGPDPQDAAGFFADADRRRYDFQSPGANGEGRGLIITSRDPLGRDTEIAFDNFELLPVRVTDPVQLVTQATYDYRLLKPQQVTDPNNNLNLFTYTPLGLFKESFIRGKSGEGDQVQPSVRMTYDFLAFINSKFLDPQKPQPIFVHTTQRVHHDSETDVPLPERDETIERREYSDGFGRMLQTRTQAEDVLFGDPVFGDAVTPADQSDQSGTVADVIGRQRNSGDPSNVVVSGWQIYDNKGRIVQKYEPFYSAGYDYGQPLDAQFGQKIEMFYEPRGHVIRAVNPDGSEQRVVFGVPGSIAAPDFGDPDVFEPTPWEAYTYDADDNAGRTHPVAATSYRHCWDTPSSITIDSLGRTVLAIERNRDPAPPGGQLPPMVEIRTSSTYDIRGNLLTVTDALNRKAFSYAYDLANRQLRIENIDAGIRRTIFDAAGNTLEYRSSKGALCLHAYDALSRPIRLWAHDGAGETVTQREHLIYGDSAESGFTRAQAQAANLLGKLYQHYDEAGRLTCELFDFKGNLAEKIREVISDRNILSVFNPPQPDWQVQAFRIDWQPTGGGTLEDRAAALLDTVEFRISTAYDALNRIKSLRYPQDVGPSRKELQPHYNRAGALEAVALDGSPYVRRIAYNAKGQRVLIAYGNRVMTRYAYDDKMFRLLRMRTERYTQPDPMTFRPAANALQDFAYEYDLTGNTTVIRDRTPGSGVPNTQLGTDALDRGFVYDAIYRLLSANGRECDLPPNLPWDDSPRCTDVTRTRAYTETYRYDNVGNILRLQHGANRNFALIDGSNRLATMTVGQTIFRYTYDADGNLTQETTSRHFEWDHLDRMRVYRTQIGTAEPSVHAHYLYDSGGQRVKKLVRKQGGQVEASVYVDGLFEYQSVVQGGSRQANTTVHVMNDESRVAMVRIGRPFSDDTTPSVKYHLSDHLGSSNVVVGGAAATSDGFINREEYTPYGETGFGSFARKRYRFSGKERDEESGLYYCEARYYSAWLARWDSTDPKGSIDGPNLYAYTRGNPVKRRDPSGTEDVDFSDFGLQDTASSTNTEIPSATGTSRDFSLETDSVRIASQQTPQQESQPDARLSTQDRQSVTPNGEQPDVEVRIQPTWGGELEKSRAGEQRSSVSSVKTEVDIDTGKSSEIGVEMIHEKETPRSPSATDVGDTKHEVHPGVYYKVDLLKNRLGLKVGGGPVLDVEQEGSPGSNPRLFIRHKAEFELEEKYANRFKFTLKGDISVGGGKNLIEKSLELNLEYYWSKSGNEFRSFPIKEFGVFGSIEGQYSPPIGSDPKTIQWMLGGGAALRF
jgi:RHS repeat-associated protein